MLVVKIRTDFEDPFDRIDFRGFNTVLGRLSGQSVETRRVSSLPILLIPQTKACSMGLSRIMAKDG